MRQSHFFFTIILNYYIIIVQASNDLHLSFYTYRCILFISHLLLIALYYVWIERMARLSNIRRIKHTLIVDRLLIVSKA